MFELSYGVGTVTLTNDSATVTGTGTGWTTALLTGGILTPEAVGNAMTIRDVVSNTELLCETKWKGTSGTYPYAIARETSQAVSNIWISNRMAEALRTMSLSSIPTNYVGSLAERNSLNPAATPGQTYLRMEQGQPLEYYRKSIAGWDGPFPITGQTGLQGIEGRPGPSYPFLLNATVTNADPTAGRLGRDSTASSSTTKIYLSTMNAKGAAMAGIVESFGSSTSTNKAVLRMEMKLDPTKYAEFYVTSAALTGSFYTLNVTFISGVGPIPDGSDLNVSVVRTGDRGQEGRPGPARPYQWNTSTANADPGTAKVSMLAGDAAVLVSKIDLVAVNLGAIMQTWDDSTSTIKGYIRLEVRPDPSRFVEYAVTSAVNGTNYMAFLGSVAASNGVFASNEEIMVTFRQTGDKGNTGTIAVAGTNTTAAGTNASVTNGGTSTAASFTFNIPRGYDGADAGVVFNWETATADANPAAGGMRANNAALGSATFLYISKTSKAGSDVAAWLNGLASSTSPLKGTIILTDPLTKKTTLFFFTGVTDATGYVKVAITSHVGETSFANGLAVSFQVARTGNAGAGSGDFVGPANSAENEIALFSGITGKLGKRGPRLDPITILVSGQSNSQIEEPFGWTPHPNVRLWNWNAVETSTGTAFTPAPTTWVNPFVSMASEIAARTGRIVNVIKLGWGGKTITQWVGGIRQDWSTNTTIGSAPAYGYAKADNANLALVTNLRVSVFERADVGGTSNNKIGALNQIVSGFWIEVRKAGVVVARYTVSSAPTFSVDNFLIPVTYVSGSGGTLAEGDDVEIMFPPDMQMIIDNNVPAALAAANVSKVDLLCWWQGESDQGVPGTLNADTERWLTWLRNKSWFPPDTPMCISGVVPTIIAPTFPTFRDINEQLQIVVSRAPSLRKFLYPGSLGTQFWNAAVNNIHMTGAGYLRAGVRFANDFLNGFGFDTKYNQVVNHEFMFWMNTMHKIVVRGPLTLYVNTNGNDGRLGLDATTGPTGAFATIQKAIDWAASNLDMNGYELTIQLGTGTHAIPNTGLRPKDVVGASRVLILGLPADSSQTVLNMTGVLSTAIGIIEMIGVNTTYALRGVTLTASTTGNVQFGINAHSGSVFEFHDITFGAGISQHIRSTFNSTVKAIGNYAIGAGGDYHWASTGGGVIQVQGRTVIISGAHNFAGAFASAVAAGVVFCPTCTFSPVGVTGTRFVLTGNGVIHTAGQAEASYLPGSIAGTKATGGEWV